MAYLHCYNPELALRVRTGILATSVNVIIIQ